jgi:hypothetical protein
MFVADPEMGDVAQKRVKRIGRRDQLPAVIEGRAALPGIAQDLGIAGRNQNRRMRHQPDFHQPLRDMNGGIADKSAKLNPLAKGAIDESGSFWRTFA